MENNVFTFAGVYGDFPFASPVMNQGEMLCESSGSGRKAMSASGDCGVVSIHINIVTGEGGEVIDV